MSAAQVDGAVATAVALGEPLYRLDEDTIRTLQPDLILAQDLCRVVCLLRRGCHRCARPSRVHVDGAVARPDDARRRDRRRDGCSRGGGRPPARSGSRRVPSTPRRRGAAARVRCRPSRVLELEWSDPPYLGGHWVPEMVEAAGGRLYWRSPVSPRPGCGGRTSGRRPPTSLSSPPVGTGWPRPWPKGAELLGRPEMADAGEVWALDGSAYFSGPGPGWWTAWRPWPGSCTRNGCHRRHRAGPGACGKAQHPGLTGSRTSWPPPAVPRSRPRR